jgi:hypothetical protein
MFREIARRPEKFGDGSMESTLALRMPRLVEADPRGLRLLQALTAHTRLLWRRGAMKTPVVMLSAELAETLRSVSACGQAIRSLELAEQALAAEERGLRMADQQVGAPRGVRVSRLILLANDGAERFYRNVETLLGRYGPRILAVRLETDADVLGGLLFGPGHMARLVMLSHKKAVSSALLAMAGSLFQEHSIEEVVNKPCNGMIVLK